MKCEHEYLSDGGKCIKCGLTYGETFLTDLILTKIQSDILNKAFIVKNNNGNTLEQGRYVIEVDNVMKILKEML